MNFIAPLGLLLGLLAIPILALYFLKIRRRRVTVPSLLLWEQFAKTERLARPFDKFRQNLLLWLQLLLLLLLVLAFARPFLNSDVGMHRSMVLVIDNSASMAATDVNPNRLASAISAAQGVVSSMGPADEATVVVAGARTRVAAPFSRDQSLLYAALDTIEVDEANGSLREGLVLALSLARARTEVEVIVLSDGSNETFDSLPINDTPITFRRVGRSDANSGIVALDLRTSPASELDRQLFVTAQNFGDRTVQGTVQVYLDDKLIGLRTETLGDKPQAMVFDLPSGASGELRVDLKADDDMLPIDDVAWAIVRPFSKRDVLLVDGDRLTRRVLESDPRVRLSVSPSSKLTAQMLTGADAVFFNGDVAPDVDGVNYAVLRPTSSSPVRFGSTYKKPEVLRWRRAHPLMRFVGWAGINMKEAKKVTDAGGLATLVESKNGPLLLAGERHGGRVVQLTFDPLKTDLPLRVAWPVLLLNTVGWLTENRASVEHGSVVKAGDPWVHRLPIDVPSEQVRVTGPQGEPTFSLSEGLLRVQDTTKQGIYSVKAKGQKYRFAVNLHSPEESNIR
ncbi:MAG: Ca-activated chloride channel family protein, partial [Kiritimatiellia bacterium]